jgi:hypothetical protein
MLTPILFVSIRSLVCCASKSATAGFPGGLVSNCVQLRAFVHHHNYYAWTVQSEWSGKAAPFCPTRVQVRRPGRLVCAMLTLLGKSRYPIHISMTHTLRQDHVYNEGSYQVVWITLVNNARNRRVDTMVFSDGCTVIAPSIGFLEFVVPNQQ